MYFSILLTLLILKISIGVASTNSPEKCPYENTVNLTNHKKFDNGSYLYEGILIPPEKQDFYDYHLDFMRKRITVPRHLRGCVCSEDQPCIKLCCEMDEYLNMSECEKLTPKMKVQWKLPIQRKNYEIETVDIFKHFTTQVELPCRWPVELDQNFEEWILKENGILSILWNDYEHNTWDYCYSQLPIENSQLPLEKDSTEYVLTPFSCPRWNVIAWKIILNTYAPLISMLFLLATILVYSVLRELREHLSGQLMICYVLSQIVFNAILSFINISNIRFDFILCFIMGYTAYYFNLSFYLWLSVVCYDISKTFNNINSELNLRRDRKKFIIYSLYVWLTAGIATAIGILLDLLPNVDEMYKAGVGLEICFINAEKPSAVFYLYGPSLIILLFNLVIFIRLITIIYKTRRDAARLKRNKNIFIQNALVILRLSLILGIPWIFDILSAWNIFDFLYVVSDIIIAIQGFLTFSLFVIRPKVWYLIKKRFEKSERLPGVKLQKLKVQPKSTYRHG